MPGVTKRIYEHDLRDIQDMMSDIINNIKDILPPNYNMQDIIYWIKMYYPHEWESITYKKQYYDSKDKYLRKHFGRARYNMQSPERILQSNRIYKKITEIGYVEKYSASYVDVEAKQKTEILEKKRKKKIERIDKKIESAKAKTQQVTPDFLEQLIGLYNRQNTSQMDRMYIIIELQKYYNPRIINFFFKLNDTELNKQLREIAFKHLQSFNYQPRLRRQKYMQIHTKKKSRKEYLLKVYPFERYNVPKNPHELEYRINNSKEQTIKSFDYFISHSSKDRAAVQRLINNQNENGNNVFCDWISDVDYLKRHLLCDATLSVLECRMKQSKAMIFVISDNSINSVWCKYELNYFAELKRPIYCINKDDIELGVFNISELVDKWYLDKEYRKLALLESKNIMPKQKEST